MNPTQTKLIENSSLLKVHTNIMNQNCQFRVTLSVSVVTLTVCKQVIHLFLTQRLQKQYSCKLLLEHPTNDVNAKHTFNFYLIYSITKAKNVQIMLTLDLKILFNM